MQDTPTSTVGKPLSAGTNAMMLVAGSHYFQNLISLGAQGKGNYNRWWSQKKAPDFSRLGTIM